MSSDAMAANWRSAPEAVLGQPEKRPTTDGPATPAATSCVTWDLPGAVVLAVGETVILLTLSLHRY